MTITINGVDKTSLIDWQSVKIEKNVTNLPDFFSFQINTLSASQTYIPTKGHEVVVSHGGDTLFGGVVLDVRIKSDSGVSGTIYVTCKDYTHLLDRKQVVETYEAQTVTYIINDILTKYCPDITNGGVATIATTLQKIRFAYVAPSMCLQELADICNCDWYVDYAKVLYFQPKGFSTAPFNLTENKESFVYNSLEYEDDLSQIRNSIYIRGGTERYTTDASTAEKYVCDGQQRVFPLGQKYVNDAVFSIAKDTGGGFVALTVGVYGQDDPTAYDCLYDSNNKSVIFPDGSKPAATNVLRIYGNYYLPVVVNVVDMASITTYGEYQFRIVDQTISSKDEARQRARAELLRYAESINQGRFETYRAGLEPGMVITVTLPTLGLTGITFYVQRVSTTLLDPSGATLRYNVDVVGTEVVNSIDVLLRLLVGNVSKNIEIGDDEILDKVYGSYETITLTEGTFTATKYPSGSPDFTETITFSAEVITGEPFGHDVDPIWVAGDYWPSPVSTNKRVPQIDAGLACQ